MLDLRHVVENLEQVRDALNRRSAADAALVDSVAELGDKRRTLLTASQSKQAERNAASKAMGQVKDKQSPEFVQRREDLKALSAEVKDLEREQNELMATLEAELSRLPNLLDASVPTGKGEEDNVVVSTWGEAPKQDFEVKPHYDLGPELGILDFERAAKLSGPRFVVMRGAAARLERALIQFMLDLHTSEHGYEEVAPPFLVKESALFGTGQLPKFEEDLFKTHKNDPETSYALYLNPTAEVPLTNLYADEILDGADLPLALTAYTPCFRSEAGSYGKDVRGMIRQHQFDKVELVRICRPEDSMAQLEKLTRHAETVLERLGLHYRRSLLCSGDTGFASVKTYDLEVWLPSQDKFREISSCSNCGDFQARRAKIRFRADKGSKPQHAHTLNGSGLAVGRTLIAIMEQYQQADGTIVVPEVLRDAMKMDVIGPAA